MWFSLAIDENIGLDCVALQNSSMHRPLNMVLIIFALIVGFWNSIRFKIVVCNLPRIGILCVILVVMDLLFFVLLRWFAPRKPVLAFNSIIGLPFIRLDLNILLHWQQFEVQIRQCIARHITPYQLHEISILAFEQELRTICSLFFPKR